MNHLFIKIISKILIKAFLKRNYINGFREFKQDFSSEKVESGHLPPCFCSPELAFNELKQGFIFG